VHDGPLHDVGKRATRRVVACRASAGSSANERVSAGHISAKLWWTPRLGYNAGPHPIKHQLYDRKLCAEFEVIPRMRKRLLFVVNVAWFFTSHRLPVALLAKEAGFEVHLAAVFGLGERERIESLGIRTHPVRFSRAGASPFELLRDLWHLCSLLRRFRSDVLHLVTLKPILVGGLAARLVGLRRVVLAIPGRGSVFSARGPLASMRRWCALLAYRWAYVPSSTKIIVQNVEDGDYFVLRGVFRRNDVRLIRGSGADLGRFRASCEPAGIPIVVLASRMLHEKGVRDFVVAASLLKNRGLHARFALVGEPDAGNPRSHTREELESWARAGAVEWWGFRADMDAVLTGCHVVCLPSYYGEGVPKVLIEAAAAARPIVTTDIPGCRDIVRDDWNGVLVPTRQPVALADAIARLLSSPELRLVMGQRGRALVESEFTTQTVAGQTLALYEELLA